MAFLELICLNVANGFTYLFKNFKLQGGKVGSRRPYLPGKLRIGAVPLVQRPGDLIEVASDAPVFGGQLPDGGQQLVIDRGNRDNGTDACAPDGSADKLGLADTVGCKAGGKVGVFLLGQPGFDYPLSARRVVLFAGHRFQLLSAVSFVNRKTSPQIPKEKTAKSTGLFFNVHKFLMV